MVKMLPVWGRVVGARSCSWLGCVCVRVYVSLWLTAGLKAYAQVGEPGGVIFLPHLPLPLLVSTLALPNADLTPCRFISVIQVIC